MAAMIDYLLDVHHMDIEADSENLRDIFAAAHDSGTPLNSAIFYRNLPAVTKLLERGANPEVAVYQAIDSVLTRAYLPAVGPLLDAGADPNGAFGHAVDHLNFEAAQVCLDKGADPSWVLRLQQAKAAKKAAGTFDRYEDEEQGDGGLSSDDDEELAAERERMRNFVRSASTTRAQSAADVATPTINQTH